MNQHQPPPGGYPPNPNVYGAPAIPTPQDPAALQSETRESFIVKTYNHLFGAIVLFTLLEVAFFKAGIAETMFSVMAGSRFAWIAVLGGFVAVSWAARSVAHRTQSKPAQYAALLGYVVAEAIIFVPLLYMADAIAPGAIQSAALTTMVGFAGLTGIAFWTRKDFSFLGGLLRWGGMCAIVLIIASIVFGFKLGVFFSVAMVAFAGAAILFDTSKIIRSYPEDRYVGAALELFASVALMFWYVLRIFMSRD